MPNLGQTLSYLEMIFMEKNKLRQKVAFDKFVKDAKDAKGYHTIVSRCCVKDEVVVQLLKTGRWKSNEHFVWSDVYSIELCRHSSPLYSRYPVIDLSQDALRYMQNDGACVWVSRL